MIFSSIARVVLKHRVVALLGLLLVFLGTAGGATRLVADFSAEAFFGGDDPELDRLRAFEERWGRDDNLMTVVVDSPDGSTVLSPARLRRIESVARALEAREDVARVAAITTVPRLRGDAPGFVDLSSVLEGMPEAASADDPAFVLFADALLRHPLYVPWLLAADGRAAAIAVELDGNSDDLVWVRPVVESITAQLDEQQGQDGLRFCPAGIPAVRAGLIRVMFSDQQTLVPISALLMAVLLFLTFRTLHGVLVPGIAALVPSAMTIGLMGWTGERLGLLNQAYFTLLPILAVSDAIHMVSRFHEELRARVAVGGIPSREQREAAIVRAVEETGLACAFNSFTTAVGFCALLLSDMPIVRSFGIYAAFGVAIMYVSVLVVVPLLLSLTRGPVPDGPQEEGGGRVDRLFWRIADVSVRRPFVVFAVTLLLVGWGAWEGRKVVVDNQLTALLDADDPSVVANRLADDKLGGVLPVELALEGPPGAMKDPVVLRALLRLEEHGKEGAARTVMGPATYVASLHEVLTGRREIPPTRAGVAQVLLMGEGDADLSRVMDFDASHGRSTFLCKDWGASALIPWMEELQASADRAFAGTGVLARVTGTPLVAYRGINNVTSNLTPSVGTAFLVIAAIFSLLTRSLRAGLLAMVPNALPLLVGYGFMGFMGWDLDPSPAVMFTVALGIASDDTVHVTMRAREEVRRGMSMADAMRRTIFHSGRACTVTSLILSAGFAINHFSSFPGLRVMGALGCVILLAAMVAEVFLTPALFVVFGKGLWRRTDAPAPSNL